MRSQSIPHPARVVPAPKHCAICASLFGRRADEQLARFVQRTTCSQACRAQRANRTRLETGVDPARVEVPCEHCGETILAHPSDFNRPAQFRLRFCSRTCKDDHQRGSTKPIELTTKRPFSCLVCGAVGYVTACRADRKCCSQRCGALARAQREGRANPTKIEAAVFRALRGAGLDFEHQAIVGRFVVDFLLPKQRIAIECFGDYVHCNPTIYLNGPDSEIQRNNVSKDAVRFAELRHMGFRPAVVWGSAIGKAGAKAAIEEALAAA